MAKRSPEYVYQLLTEAGFQPQQAAIMTAIAGAESGYRNDAVGDTTLENATWGPSYGLFQIRTLKAQTGTGGDRDIQNLRSDKEQAEAAYRISRGGTDFSPWSVWNTGAYQKFLNAALSIMEKHDGPFPTLGPGWLPWNWPSNAANAGLGAAEDTAQGALAGARAIAIEGVVAVLGLALVGIGLALTLTTPGRRLLAKAKGAVT